MKKKKNNNDEKKRQSLEEFENKYFERMGKLFFILQRLSRFGTFGCLTISAGVSTYATWWDQQSNQNSLNCDNSSANSTTTALNLTVLFLTIGGIGSAGLDMYATKFLNEAKKK